MIGCNIFFPQSNFLQKVIRPVGIIVHDHEVVHPRFFSIGDLLERNLQSFGDRLVGLCSTTPEAMFQRCKGGWGYKNVEGI